VKTKKLLTVFFAMSGICLLHTNANSTPRLFEWGHNINVWQEDTLMGGMSVITTGNDDSLAIDSIYFNLNKSFPFINQLTFKTMGETHNFKADSAYSISFPNSNYGEQGISRKIVLLPSDFAYFYNWDLSFTNAHAGDTITAWTYFKFSRYYQDSIVHGTDSMVIRTIASSGSAVLKRPPGMQSQFKTATTNRFDVLGRRINLLGNDRAARFGQNIFITNGLDPKIKIYVGTVKTK
jgi:hypothetical protein